MTTYNETSSINTAGVFSSKLYVVVFAIKTVVKDLKIFSLNTLPATAPFKHKARSLLILLMLLATSKVQAQQSISYALHANIIYRFTKYVEWPDYEKSGNFIIGIVGDTPLFNELEQFIENKTVGSKKIVIKKMSSSADSYNCQILFISEDKSKSLKKIAEITSATSTLIVSESSGLASKGSCINFVIVNDHLKLEINKNNILQHNLNIANELLSLGVLVK
jgi:hypothetical protein